MPLTMAAIGEENIIRRVGGNEETSVFLKTWDLLQSRDHRNLCHRRKCNCKCQRLQGGDQSGYGKAHNGFKKPMARTSVVPYT